MKKRRTINRIDAALKLVPWRVDEKTGCWICGAGRREKTGYRHISLLGGRTFAHRLAYRLFHGPVPRGLVVRHTCDNTECINPEHLLLGSKADNSADMVARGRASRWEDRPGRPGHKRKRKLALRQIRAIRRRPESSYELAPIYGVSSVQIRRIRNGSRCAGL